MSETQSIVPDVSRVEASLNNGREFRNELLRKSDRGTPRPQRRQRQVGTYHSLKTFFGRLSGSKNRADVPAQAITRSHLSSSSPQYGSRYPNAQGRAGDKNSSPFPQRREVRVPGLKLFPNIRTADTFASRVTNRPRKVTASAARLFNKTQSFSGRSSPAQTQNSSRHPLHLGQQLPNSAAKGVRRPTSGIKNSQVKPSRDVKLKTPIDARAQNIRSISPLLYGTRLLILGVGIGALVGTLLSVMYPASRLPAASSMMKIEAHSKQFSLANPSDEKGSTLERSLKLGQEISPLRSQLQTLVKQNPNLQPGVFFVDIDNGTYLDMEGSSTFPAASTIKLPILVAFFQDVDTGKIHLDEYLTLRRSMIGSGSGDLQYRRLGTKFNILEVVTKMITISDNTATNMLIARMGGPEALNQRFAAWGLTSTTINNALPDLAGTNTTSPKELATLIAMVNQGDFVSRESRSRILEIMQKTVTNSLLPKGLGKGATIAHKTGDIGSLVGDVGLISTPTGKHYIAAVMVKRPYNDPHAQELIRQISHQTYQFFNSEESGLNTQKSD